MIQRIQTLYLFIAAAVLCLSLFGPLAIVYQADVALEFKAFVVHDMPQVGFLGSWPIGLVFTFSAVLFLVMIFKYSNRKLQMWVSILSIILTLVGIAMAFTLPYDLASKMGETAKVNFSVSVFLPIISVLFGIMAVVMIRKDENLIRSADRLR